MTGGLAATGVGGGAQTARAPRKARGIAHGAASRRRVLAAAALLLFSGSPFLSTGTRFGTVAVAALPLIVFASSPGLILGRRARHLRWYVAPFLAVLAGQYLVLPAFGSLAALGFIAKIVFGYVLLRAIGVQFRSAYFRAMYLICAISLVGYALSLLGLQLPDRLAFSETARSAVLFTQVEDGSRNSGAFWEPGAFACYINLAFLLYLGRLRLLLQRSRWRVAVLALALVTTFSTTGYIVAFGIVLVTVMREYAKSLRVAVMPVAVAVAVLVAGAALYQGSTFLKSKIEGQTANALLLQGEFANTRVGALLFDLYYIQKHPWIGNGLIETTRYADHPELQGVALGHGNGFSNFIASTGLVSMAVFVLALLRGYGAGRVAFVVGVLLLLQGEQLLDYPLLLSLPLAFRVEGERGRRGPGRRARIAPAL